MEELQWPFRYPTDVYDYWTTRWPKGSPIQVGERLHDAMHIFLTKGAWIYPEYYVPCQTILEILDDLGLPKNALQSEMPIGTGRLRGRVDLCGRLADGRSCITEIKTTLGDHAEPPSHEEIVQMGCYANLQSSKKPVLICMRVLLRENKICVFRLDDTDQVLAQVRGAIGCLN